MFYPGIIQSVKPDGCPCQFKPHIGQHTDILLVIRSAKLAAHRGLLNRKDFDHNDPDYVTGAGLSNKQVNIVARDVLGRSPVDFDEAWAVFMELVTGWAL